LIQLDGLLLFLLMLVPLVILQRLLHGEIQAILLIWTRDPALTIGLFSMLFLPGVILHELSHYFMARLLGVRTGGFSIVPQASASGRLQLGYVETARTDPVRDSLVGLAPLIVGGLFVAYAAIERLHLLPLWDVFRNAQFELFWMGLKALPQEKDFPLWFYLTFAVSSTMLPSASDRHAWLPLALYTMVLFGLALLAGMGSAILQGLTVPLNNFLRSVATMFGISVMIHLILVTPLLLIHRAVAAASGVDVR